MLAVEWGSGLLVSWGESWIEGTWTSCSIIDVLNTYGRGLHEVVSSVLWDSKEESDVAGRGERGLSWICACGGMRSTSPRELGGSWVDGTWTSFSIIDVLNSCGRGLHEVISSFLWGSNEESAVASRGERFFSWIHAYRGMRSTSPRGLGESRIEGTWTSLLIIEVLNKYVMDLYEVASRFFMRLQGGERIGESWRKGCVRW